MRQQAVLRERPKHPSWDRIFFAGMILLLWATVLVGFAKTYFLAGMMRAPLPNALIHIHGAAFTLWMVLLLVQTVLISARQVRWHKRLGLAGFGLAVTMVVLGVLAATDSLRRKPLGVDANAFYVVPISDMLVFSVLVYCAYRARFKPATHKRLILIATIGLIDAAVGRLPIAYVQAHVWTMLEVVPLGFLLLVAAYDKVSLGRVLRSTVSASVFLAIVLLARIPLGSTPAWQAFATHMAGQGSSR
jgi:hypothetical protein